MYDNHNRTRIDNLEANPEGKEKMDLLEHLQSKAYIVKYSVEGAELPGPQVATKNPSNACWANASTVFAGAFTSFDYCKGLVASNDEKKGSALVTTTESVIGSTITSQSESERLSMATC